LVSIIIPAYNAAKWISRAIDSVLAQTYPHVEVIVVDDGSTDNTDSVCRSYKNQIRYLYQPNAGVSTARNRGIKCASGGFIGFLDADDVLLPEMVAELMRALYEFPMAQAAAGAHLWNSGKKTICRPSKGRVLSTRSIGLIDNFFDVYRKNHTAIWTGAILVKRNILEEIGGFREDVHFGEDTDMWVRIGGKHQWVFVDHPVAVYNHKPESSRTLHISAGDIPLSALFDEKEMRKLIDSNLWDAYRRFRRDRASAFARVLLFEGQDDLARSALTTIAPASISLNWLFARFLAYLPYNIRYLLAKCIGKKTGRPTT